MFQDGSFDKFDGFVTTNASIRIAPKCTVPFSKEMANFDDRKNTPWHLLKWLIQNAENFFLLNPLTFSLWLARLQSVFHKIVTNCLVFINLLTSQRIGRIFEAFIVFTSMWVVYYDALSCIQSAHMSHHSDRRHCHIAWPSSSLLSSRLNRRKVASFHAKNNQNVSKSTPTRRFPRHLI